MNLILIRIYKNNLNDQQNKWNNSKINIYPHWSSASLWSTNHSEYIWNSLKGSDTKHHINFSVPICKIKQNEKEIILYCKLINQSELLVKQFLLTSKWLIIWVKSLKYQQNCLHCPWYNCCNCKNQLLNLPT